MSNMLLSRIQTVILRTNGGSEHLKVLNEKLKTLDAEELKHLYRVLENIRQEGWEEGRREGRRDVMFRGRIR